MSLPVAVIVAAPVTVAAPFCVTAPPAVTLRIVEVIVSNATASDSLIVTAAPVAPIEPKALFALSSVMSLPVAVIVAAPVTVAAAF